MSLNSGVTVAKVHNAGTLSACHWITILPIVTCPILQRVPEECMVKPWECLCGRLCGHKSYQLFMTACGFTSHCIAPLHHSWFFACPTICSSLLLWMSLSFARNAQKCFLFSECAFTICFHIFYVHQYLTLVDINYGVWQIRNIWVAYLSLREHVK